MPRRHSCVPTSVAEAVVSHYPLKTKMLPLGENIIGAFDCNGKTHGD
jgi:hypothetical protein